MNKEKQIEEMARIICSSHNNNACVFNHEPCDFKCSANGEAIKLYNAGYRKASDVAREIFEEIDRMCIDTFGNFNHRVFAELKKKYTESERDNASR